MKQIYFLFLLILLGVNQSFAQPCPESGGAIQNGNTIVFYYPNSATDCANMPNSLTVRDNLSGNTSTFSLDTNACADIIATYTLRSGNPLSGQGFVVEFGFNTTCAYSDGTLPVEAFKLKGKDLKIYPSPVVNGQEMALNFGLETSAKIEIYNITGKLVLSDNVKDKTSKTINVAGFSNGLYLVKIATEYTTINRKVVISK